MQPQVIAFGEILWDLLPQRRVLGGAAFNFTARLTSLEIPALLVSAVGDDVLGHEALSQVAQLGCSAEGIEVLSSAPTGTVPVVIDEHNVPSYTITEQVAFDYATPSAAMLQKAAAAEWLYFGTLAQRTAHGAESLALLHRHAVGAKRFYDINLRKNCFSASGIQSLLAHADVLKINHEEIEQCEALFGWPQLSIIDFCKKVGDSYGVQTVLVTLGEKGAVLYEGDGTIVYEAGYDAPVADVLGAGDACSAGFITTLLQGKSSAEACAFGNVLGTLVVMQQGATAPLGLQHIEALKAANYPRLVDERFARYRLQSVF
jgi:fructokinase